MNVFSLYYSVRACLVQYYLLSGPNKKRKPELPYTNCANRRGGPWLELIQQLCPSTFLTEKRMPQQQRDRDYFVCVTTLHTQSRVPSTVASCTFQAAISFQLSSEPIVAVRCGNISVRLINTTTSTQQNKNCQPAALIPAQS